MRSEISSKDQERSFIDKARRAQIIDCAIDVLAERGLAGATLAEIAKRAGVSKGVISYHFSGKNELIQQVVETVYGDAYWKIFEAMGHETTAAGKLATYIRENLEFMRVNHKRMLAVVHIFTAFRKDDGTLFYDVSYNAELHGVLAAICEQGQAAGEFRPFDARVMAIAVQAALDSILVLIPHQPEADLGRYADELIELFRHATRSPSPA